MFQKKQIIYSETLGVCVVDNIVSLAASKERKGGAVLCAQACV